MKRSEINHLIREAIEFFNRHQFHLPAFAHWTPADWQRKGPEAREIARHLLGWDITDFGLGDFYKTGLLLFTIRNGQPQNLRNGTGKVYAEKIMIVREDQLTPWHHHRQKTEDIINRGGGRLVIELANATPDGKGLADSEVIVSIDGVEHRLAAHDQVTLNPGESITLTTGLQHKFWGQPGAGWVLTGEVSCVNDDTQDNFFYEQVGRFPEIEEDEPPFRLLVGDYPRYYAHA